MQQQFDSWHPVIVAIIKTQPEDQAASAILSLMPQMMSNASSSPAPTPAPAPSPPPATRPRLHAVTSSPAAPEKPLDDRMEKDGTMKPYEWFSIKEAAAYVGVQVNTVHERVRKHPENLVITKVPGKKREEYRVQGRGLNAWKQQRSNGAVLATDDDSDGVPPGAERGGRGEQ